MTRELPTGRSSYSRGKKIPPPFSTMKGPATPISARRSSTSGLVLLVQMTRGIPSARVFSSAGRAASQE